MEQAQNHLLDTTSKEEEKDLNEAKNDETKTEEEMKI